MYYNDVDESNKKFTCVCPLPVRDSNLKLFLTQFEFRGVIPEEVEVIIMNTKSNFTGPDGSQPTLIR